MPSSFGVFSVLIAGLSFVALVALLVVAGGLIDRILKSDRRCPKCQGIFRYLSPLPKSLHIANKNSYVDFPVRLCLGCGQCQVQKPLCCSGCGHRTDDCSIDIGNGDPDLPVRTINVRLACARCGMVRIDHKLLVNLSERKGYARDLVKVVKDLNRVRVYED